MNECLCFTYCFFPRGWPTCSAEQQLQRRTPRQRERDVFHAGEAAAQRGRDPEDAGGRGAQSKPPAERHPGVCSELQSSSLQQLHKVTGDMTSSADPILGSLLAKDRRDY